MQNSQHVREVPLFFWIDLIVLVLATIFVFFSVQTLLRHNISGSSTITIDNYDGCDHLDHRKMAKALSANPTYSANGQQIPVHFSCK